MRRNHGNYCTKLVATKAPALGNGQVIKPDLYCGRSVINVNVRRLVRLVAEEVQTVGSLAENSRHATLLTWPTDSPQAVNFYRHICSKCNYLKTRSFFSVGLQLWTQTYVPRCS